MLDAKIASTFTFTFYDVIGHLIPGSIVLLLFYHFEKIHFSFPVELSFIILLFVGYTVGQMLSAIGNLLYHTYFYPDDYNKQSFTYRIVNITHKIVKFFMFERGIHPGLDIKTKISSVINKKLKIDNLNNRSFFQICDTLVAEDGFSERDILLARQEFYRSISALIIVVTGYGIFKGGLGFPIIYWLISLVVITRFLLYIHNYYGQIRKNQIYFLAYMKLRKMR